VPKKASFNQAGAMFAPYMQHCANCWLVSCLSARKSGYQRDRIYLGPATADCPVTFPLRCPQMADSIDLRLGG